jgi:hypothetical protein
MALHYAVRDDMKRVWFLCFMIGILSMVLLPILGSAQGTGLEIQSVNAQLLKTRSPVGTTVIHEYQIIAVLYNNDTATSENITVKFLDPEVNNTLNLFPLNATLGPKETKVFTSATWPTALSGPITLNVSFAPRSLEVVLTPKNSGYYHYTLNIPSTQKKTSTPGFEIVLVLCAVALFLLLQRKKQ